MAITTAYNAGLAALKQNNLTAAGAQFETVVRLSPQDAGAQMLLGFVRLKQERFAEAVTSLQAARDNGAQLPARSRAEIFNNLGIAQWNLQLPTEAIAAYQNALQLDNSYNEARYNLAFALLASGRQAEALPYLTALSQSNPRDASVWDGLGEAYENANTGAKALGAYKRALSLEPRNATYSLHLAMALINTDRKDDAAGYLRQTIKLDPQNATAFLQLGTIFIDRGRWSDAQEALGRYVALEPKEFAGWYNLGISRDYAADFDRALEAYAQAEALMPRDAAVKNNIGRIYYKRGKLDQAVAKTREALALDPNYFYARHNLALALTAQSKQREANAEWQILIDALGRALPQVPASEPARKKDLFGLLVAARSAVAENFLNLGLYADAASQYGQLLKLSPNNLTAMSNRGLALYRIKSYGEAATVYREVIKRDPKNAVAFNNLGVVLEAQGKKPEALSSYRQALKLKANYSEARANVQRLTAGTVLS